MVLGMGPTELAVILLVVLVIFGPKNLPKLGSALGKTVKNVREGMEEGDSNSSTVHAESHKAEAARTEAVDAHDDAATKDDE